MTGRHLSILAVVAVLAIVAALWSSKVREPVRDADEAGGYLLPGLDDALNDITGVTLTGAGNETIATLTRGDETWQVAEKNGYRANVGDLRTLLLRLSEATLLEEKTANPDYYSRLGVESVEAADAAGLLVEIDGADVPAVIVGNQVASREAVYARRAGEPKSWLVNGSIFIARDTMQWLDRQPLDVDAARVAEVEIAHPDGETFLISKAEFGQANFDVANVPEGRELQRANIANSVGSALRSLNIDDVQQAESFDFDELDVTRANFRMFDGLVVTTDTVTRDDKYYVRFGADTSAEVAARYQRQDATGDAEAPGDGADTQAADGITDADTVPAGDEVPPVEEAVAPPDLDAVTAEAEEIRERLEQWVFEIPKFKYDFFTRRMADVLAEETESPTP